MDRQKLFNPNWPNSCSNICNISVIVLVLVMTETHFFRLFHLPIAFLSIIMQRYVHFLYPFCIAGHRKCFGHIVMSPYCYIVAILTSISLWEECNELNQAESALELVTQNTAKNTTYCFLCCCVL